MQIMKTGLLPFLACLLSSAIDAQERIYQNPIIHADYSIDGISFTDVQEKFIAKPAGGPVLKWFFLQSGDENKQRWSCRY